jgi:predicted HAD superfamily Cof-like phosphohydrolase
MTKEQWHVVKFMTMIGRDSLPNSPTIPSVEIIQLRARLMLEECLETIDAMGIQIEIGISRTSIYNGVCIIDVNSDIEFRNHHNCDMVLVADGLADSHYIGYCGTGNAFGIDMEKVFDEVHRSNMTKLWTDQEVQDNKYFIEVQHTKKYVNCVGDRHWCVKDLSGKVIKSPSYSPANISAVLDSQGK